MFYSIGGLTLADAVFLGGLGFYLYRALRRLAAGQEFSPSRSRVLFLAGLASCFMFTGKMLFNTGSSLAFEAKTRHLFALANRDSSPLYVALGLVLLICAGVFSCGKKAS